MSAIGGHEHARFPSDGLRASFDRESWAFKNRSWLPVPLASTLLLMTIGEWESLWTGFLGISLVIGGLALRAAAVRHIGTISRTRIGRTGTLVTTGPYAVCRNPLYVANFLLWTAVVFLSELLWMLPVVWTLFAIQYGTIVSWEESLLRSRFPIAYPLYYDRVSRWWPRLAPSTAGDTAVVQPWTAVLFSERGTFLAVVAVLILLALKEAIS